MHDHIKKKTQEFRMLEDAVRLESKKAELTELEEKQQEVLKQLGMRKIIKQE